MNEQIVVEIEGRINQWWRKIFLPHDLATLNQPFLFQWLRQARQSCRAGAGCLFCWSLKAVIQQIEYTTSGRGGKRFTNNEGRRTRCCSIEAAEFPVRDVGLPDMLLTNGMGTAQQDPIDADG
ncbi:hypothetical protein OAL35_02025 [bacterium]|nr:hypothetical protein [bacterium]